MSERGTILMSRKERDVLVVMERVKRKEMKLVEAAEVLSISYRQCCRRKRRYLEEGAAGLVHRARGVESNRRMPKEVRKKIVEIYSSDDYKEFGPVLFTEKLDSIYAIKADHAGGAPTADKRGVMASGEQAEEAAPGVARAAISLWRVGADGWVASRMV